MAYFCAKFKQNCMPKVSNLLEFHYNNVFLFLFLQCNEKITSTREKKISITKEIQLFFFFEVKWKKYVSLLPYRLSIVRVIWLTFHSIRNRSIQQSYTDIERHPFSTVGPIAVRKAERTFDEHMVHREIQFLPQPNALRKIHLKRILCVMCLSRSLSVFSSFAFSFSLIHSFNIISHQMKIKNQIVSGLYG